MRGYPYFNFPAFAGAAARLRTSGHEVVSPAEMDRALGFDEAAQTLAGFDMRAALKRDVEALFEVDGIYMLTGWESSNGARAEHALAVALGLVMFYE